MAFRAWGQWLSCQLGLKVSFRDPLSNDHTVHRSDIFDSQIPCPLCWRCDLRMVLSKPVTSFEEIVVRPFTRVWSKCRGIAPSLAPGDPFLVEAPRRRPWPEMNGGEVSLPTYLGRLQRDEQVLYYLFLLRSSFFIPFSRCAHPPLLRAMLPHLIEFCHTSFVFGDVKCHI